VKFTGQGKVPTQDLFNLQIAIEVALHSVEAPQDYFDILDLESQVEEFSSKVNRNTYLILHQVTESKAHELVNRFCKTFDGRQAWKALQNEFLPIDALSLANLLTLVQAKEKLHNMLTWLRLHPFVDKHTTTRLHLDNDSVFRDQEFQHTCEAASVLLTWAAPYIPQTNSRIEVVWRDTTRMSHSFLIQSGLPYVYWPLAFHHAVLIGNCMPRRQLNYDSSYRLAFRTVPDLTRVRIFGCAAFAWVPEDHRKKLDDRAVETVYVGHRDLLHSPHQFLLLNRETGTVRSYAKPVFCEKLDEQSRRLAKVDLDGFLPTIAAQFGTAQPSPWSLEPISTRDRRILDVAAYYDESDHETVGCVQFISASHTRGAWTSARHYLAQASGAWHHLLEFLNNYDRLGRLLPLFPVYARVEAKFTRKYVPGIVVAVDISRTDFEDTAYTVAADYDEGVEPLDALVKNVRFPQVARGARTAAALEPLTPSSASTSTSTLAPALTPSSTTPPEDLTLDKTPYYTDYTNYVEPQTRSQALLLPDAAHWEEAMQAELRAHQVQGSMEFLYDLPPHKRALDTKWVYKLKKNANGSLDKYKGRIVAKGFLQRPGIDYTETFAPGTQLSSLRVLLVLAAAHNLNLTHIDVKTAFLNSYLNEEIYIKLPEGVKTKEGHHFAKLLKSIYGLKQAAHDWNQCLDTFLKNFDKRLRRSVIEPTLYFIFTEELVVLILTHVDDCIIASNNQHWVQKFTTALNTEYGINLLGDLKHFMQMSIAFDNNQITISQQRTIEELAIEYHLENCKPNTQTPMASNLELVHFDEFDPNLPYRNLLGSLLWLARGTRPDISFAVGYLSQFCHSYGEEHFNAARRVLKYLIATKDRTLVLPKINHKVLTITAYSDSV
jgi:hypothetical protein